jgi:hypothetical protein
MLQIDTDPCALAIAVVVHRGDKFGIAQHRLKPSSFMLLN